MNSDGTRIRRLTINGAQDFLPAWSPDGTKIAFQSNRTGDAEVFVMTRTARVLGEPHQGPAGADGSPDWSNNGAKIAFQSNRDGNEEVYAMNSDGSNQTNLTHNAALDAFPAFSADGRRIAFSSDRTTGTGVDNADGDDGIFRMGAGGRGGPTHLQHRD
jgi:Tol biopolymer transport system component